LELTGEANDYAGKGLSGATIVIRPAPEVMRPELNAILGNTVLYGATSGRLFAAGLAGERFAVRNSGATTVVEGCGANGLEYMTGGTAVILGPVGFNFAAGMTGGMAFVYDPQNTLSTVLNPESVVTCGVSSEHWAGVLKGLVEEHARETGSGLADELLRDWDRALPRFRQVCPKEMVGRLDHALEAEEAVHRRA
ncbi:MAG: glutamate synthase large subunit, partial [Phenylobacterium sp.]